MNLLSIHLVYTCLVFLVQKKIGSVCSEYDLNVINLTIFFEYLLVSECEVCKHYPILGYRK